MTDPKTDMPCPDPDRWRKLLIDALPADEQAALAGHLEVCERCREVFDELAAGAPAWDGARELAAGTETEAYLGASVRDPSGLPFLESSEVDGRIGRFGPYEVIGVVGRGGMGVVLKAFDPSLHRVVAVKVLAPQLSAGVAARKRFVREARAAASVAHEHVVTIHSVDEWRGWPYLVMQYVGGKSLQDRIDRDGPLEVKEILRIGMQAAQGLAAAHAQGLVHRDIKPANILLENGVERVKLTDFGLARAVDDPSLTQAGVVAGTPQYMSPEQARGDAVDARSDLFSLGSVLYAMATGRPPFRGDSTVGVIRRVCDEEPRPIRESNTDIPAWLDAVIRKLLAKDPAFRFTSAEEVGEVLGDYLARLQRGEAIVEEAPAGLGLSGLHDAALDVGLAKAAGVEDVGPSKAPGGRPIPWKWAVAASVLGLMALGTTEALGVTKVGDLVATVLRIKVPEGTLVVEAADPEMQIAIDGGDIVVHGGGVRELKLKAGQHRVEALQDGRPMRVELVEIHKGDRQTLRIGLEPLGAPNPVVPGPPDGVPVLVGTPAWDALRADIGVHRARLSAQPNMAELANPGLEERARRSADAEVEAKRRLDAGEIGRTEYLAALDTKLGDAYWIAVRDRERVMRDANRALLDAIEAALDAEAEAIGERLGEHGLEEAAYAARGKAIALLRARVDAMDTSSAAVRGVLEEARRVRRELLDALDPAGDREATFTLTGRLKRLEGELANERQQESARKEIAEGLDRLDPRTTTAAMIFRQTGWPSSGGDLLARIGGDEVRPQLARVGPAARLKAIADDCARRQAACEQDAHARSRGLARLEAAVESTAENLETVRARFHAGVAARQELLESELAWRDVSESHDELEATIQGLEEAVTVWEKIGEAAGLERTRAAATGGGAADEESMAAEALDARAEALEALRDWEHGELEAARGAVRRKAERRTSTQELLKLRQTEVEVGKLAQNGREIREARRLDEAAAADLKRAEERLTQRERRLAELGEMSKGEAPAVEALHLWAMTGLPDLTLRAAQGFPDGFTGGFPADVDGPGLPGEMARWAPNRLGERLRAVRALRGVVGGAEVERQMRQVEAILQGIAGPGHPDGAPLPSDPPGGEGDMGDLRQGPPERLADLEDALREIDSELETLRGEPGGEAALQLRALGATRDELRRALEELRRQVGGTPPPVIPSQEPSVPALPELPVPPPPPGS